MPLVTSPYGGDSTDDRGLNTMASEGETVPGQEVHWGVRVGLTLVYY